MNVIGFIKQKKYFEDAQSNGTLAHAYLFSGPAMVGKKMFAFWLAELLQGRDVMIDPDVKLLEPPVKDGKAKGILIESIRELNGFISLRPLQGPRKIVIVDDAERLTEDAANAFLKLLEEPPAYAVFLLISSRPEDVLPTIRSRLLNIKFFAHSSDAIEGVLADYRLSSSDAKLLTLLADGRIGWAINALRDKQVPAIKKQLDEFQDILKTGLSERMLYAKRIVDEGVHREAVVLWMSWIRANGKNPDKTRVVLSRLLKLHTLLDQPQFHHRLALENFLINI